ncbi:damage-inducible protein DinB [Chitinophaga sp. Mgbs1]|uniref:Damage-inducible protein DinB n=1 Tax=Chitinophaga solisilvae TaxID=1233460 RepID=A0A3S1JAA0_9BACT|nr:damage-inducible protein DinB [Chitinophaga solisilvae]
MNATTELTATVISPEEIRKHWQSHRGLTRRLIEAFPEDQFFTFSIGGMRPFSELIAELNRIAASAATGLPTGNWHSESYASATTPATKAEVLALWDNVTTAIDSNWPLMTLERFHETDKAFGMYEGVVYSLLLYFIDNEIHHRGQAYVYFRALGLEPVPFWDRN